MPDEAIDTAPSTDASVADTPNMAPVSDGQGTTESSPEDAEQGYLRHADYTRKTQALAEQQREFEAKQEEYESFQNLVRTALIEQDEEAAEQLLGTLGYDFGDEQEYGESADPEVAQLRSQLDELTEWKAQQQAEADARNGAIHIETEFDRLGLGSWDGDNPAHNAVIALSFANDTGEGPLNVEAGYNEYQKLRDHVIEDLRQSKLAPQSDYGSPASAAPIENASLEDRVRAAMERNGL